MKYHLDNVGIRVEELGFYATESEITNNRLMYVLGNDEIAFINSGGAIRMGLEDILKVCEEVPEIINEFNTYARQNTKNCSMRKFFKSIQKYSKVVE